MKLIYQATDTPEAHSPASLLASVREAERIRNEQESACFMFISDNGLEVLLVGDADGEMDEDIKSFADSKAFKIEEIRAAAETQAEDLLFSIQNEADGDKPVTTHQLAKALLALPETPLDNEHHTEVWSSSIGSLEAQVAVRTW